MRASLSPTPPLWLLCLGLAPSLLCCGGDSEAGRALDPGDASAARQAADGGSSSAGDASAEPSCSKRADCVDLDTSYFNYPACCSPHTPCGYQINYDDAFFEVYPQVRDILFNLASDDPEGKCVPEEYVFPKREGTYDHRVEQDGPEADDVLVAQQCESRGFWVYTLPGCCMPDDSCGISTDEIAGTFEVLLDGESAPFSKPECLSADDLNAQLRDSKLAAFARFPATSAAACDYAALAQANPRFRHPSSQASD